MTKTLWIVSGGVEAAPGIKRAKEMGLHVVVSDMDPDAPGFEYADDTIVASTYGVEETQEAALHYSKEVRPVDGVISMSADVPMTVAGVAEALGLPGLSRECARLASDKLAMKECFQEAGIAIPLFTAISGPGELERVAKESGGPVVVKPVDSRGARGVLLVTPGLDLEWAFSHAMRSSPSGRVMVEEFIEGPQISTESVIVGEGDWTPGFSHRNYEYLRRFSPYIIENGGDQPTPLASHARGAVEGVAIAAARAMGIERGIAKGDMVLSYRGPLVIEIAARLSGGWFSTDQIPLATGVDLIGAAIKLALGEDPAPEELTPTRERGVAIRYFFPEPGIVREIRGVEKYEALDWVHKLGFFVAKGDVIEETTDHTKRAGFVITTGEDRAEAVARAEEVVKGVEIVNY